LRFLPRYLLAIELPGQTVHNLALAESLAISGN
jgi:hypothetical protein